MKIARGQIIERLREAGWVFARQCPRTELWRKPGSPQRINLPTWKLFEEPLIRTVLTQAGLTREGVEQFLRQAEKIEP